MSNFTYPVLCGGTFFTLILEARKQRTSKRKKIGGKPDGLSQPDTLEGLGRVVYPEYTAPENKDTFSTNVSDYKSCVNDGTNLSFLFNHYADAFNNRVKTQYLEALKSMDDFIKRFLEIGTSLAREVWLVNALLDLINADQSIADNQKFYIAENGQGITKAALRGMSDFCLQTFLLGVWHFVIVNRPDNKAGKATYDTWCPPRGRAERKYTGTMGESNTREINVTMREMVNSELEQETASTAEDEPSAENSESYVNEAAEEASSNTTNQTVNNPLVFNQYGNSLSEQHANNPASDSSQMGDKNTQILHAENVNINNHYSSNDIATNKYLGKPMILPSTENNNFVGRSEQLKQLQDVFGRSKSSMPIIQTIQGLGGVGKTQLALKYAYNHRYEYDAICWVECKTENSIAKACCDFLSITGESNTGIPRFTDEESNTVIPRFTDWFQNHSNWLLILDDINESTSVEGLIPKLGNGHIIKTTQIAEGKLVNDLTIPLDKMSIEDAVAFLIMRTNDKDIETAKSIAVRLDGLPLALEQAAAYINELEIDLQEYLQLLCKNDLNVFDGDDSVKNYKWNVKTVWNITLGKLSEPAKKLLYCFAYMSADMLALDLLTEHAKELHTENEKQVEYIDEIGKDGKATGIKVNLSALFLTSTKNKFMPELIPILSDKLKINKAIRELKKFSLIKSKNDKTLTMHGLLQEVIRNGITNPVYLLSVAEVIKKRCSKMDLIFDDYHIALPMAQAKSIILNIETLLRYKEEYNASLNNPNASLNNPNASLDNPNASLDNPNIDMWELQFYFYSFIAQYLTLHGIREDAIRILNKADKCYATACEIGLQLYGGGEDSNLIGASKFTVIQEKHRRMRVNLILNRIDVAKKLYAEIRRPVSNVLTQEVHMSLHAFTNFGDLWREFGYYTEAKECYEYVLKICTYDEAFALREKIADCEKNLVKKTTNP